MPLAFATFPILHHRGDKGCDQGKRWCLPTPAFLLLLHLLNPFLRTPRNHPLMTIRVRPE